MSPPRKAAPPVFSPREFRASLGMFATGVTIVTARTAEGERVGLTANSFNSVSLDPPLVLWSLARAAGSLPAFSAGSHYAINILAADQKALAERFGRIRAYESVSVLTLGDDLALRELLASTSLREAILYEISPRAVVGRSEAIDALVEELTTKGFTPGVKP